ncbi:MAG: calcium/sodium antiporter [Proteobacteria bacterium]|nr:calcium/sodium antiporter [Pseudomonadota bacterium]
MMSIALIFGGGIILFFSAHYLVQSSVAVARHLRVSQLMIGLTIVAFGTSAPELVVSLDAMLTDHADIVLGNIIGSNIANLLLVLAIAAVIFPITLSQSDIRPESVVMLAATIFFGVLCFAGMIERWHGLIMLTGLAGFSYAAYKRSSTNESDEVPPPEGDDDHCGEEKPGRGLALQIAVIVLSLILLAFGAEIFVRGAVALSRLLNLSEAVIGLTVVAVGSAAPELVTAVVAARQKHTDIIIGNVLGSNIFNILGILGVTALVSPIPVSEHFLEIDIFVMLGVTVWLTIYCFTLKNIGRFTGGLLIVVYGGYLIFILR